MPDRDELELLIDSAIADYAEPRAGLEQRMLARVRDGVAARWRRRWIFAAVAAPAAAVLLLLSYVGTTPHSKPNERAHETEERAGALERSVPASRGPAESLTSAHSHRSHKILRRVAEDAVARPKLEIFPTPQPLSGQEQALSRFVAQAPEADRNSVIEAQQQLAEPLQISAIRIPPLQSPEDDNH